MKNEKKVRLARAGWVVGDAMKFLNLNPQETRYVELKLALAGKDGRSWRAGVYAPKLN